MDRQFSAERQEEIAQEVTAAVMAYARGLLADSRDGALPGAEPTNRKVAGDALRCAAVSLADAPLERRRRAEEEVEYALLVVKVENRFAELEARVRAILFGTSENRPFWPGAKGMVVHCFASLLEREVWVRLSPLFPRSLPKDCPRSRELRNLLASLASS
jgi:hypothetical protein